MTTYWECYLIKDSAQRATKEILERTGIRAIRARRARKAIRVMPAQLVLPE